MYNYYLHLRTYLIIKRKEITALISLKKSLAYTPFVILCEPRSGSTLLHTYLNFHPHIKSYGEVLREKIEQGTYVPIQPVSRYVFKAQAPNIRAVGLKLFYCYYDHLSYTGAFQEVLQRPDVKIIHLVRKDILKLYVSLKIAQKTNQWSSAKSYKQDANKMFHVDGDDFYKFSSTYLQRQQYFINLFQDHSMLTINYEDLSSTPTSILREIQLFLNVKPKKLLSLLKKQNPDLVETLVTNYEEVRNIALQIMEAHKK